MQLIACTRALQKHIRQHISQVRPAFSDNQPKIIASNALIQVNGLYRHGFLIAPIVMSQVIEHVENLIQQQHRGVDDYQYANLLPVNKIE